MPGLSDSSPVGGLRLSTYEGPKDKSPASTPVRPVGEELKLAVVGAVVVDPEFMVLGVLPGFDEVVSENQGDPMSSDGTVDLDGFRTGVLILCCFSKNSMNRSLPILSLVTIIGV